jgi:hypothetical protein
MFAKKFINVTIGINDGGTQMRKRTTISLFEDTYRRLCSIGHKQETFDQIVRRLIEFYEKHQQKGAAA